MEGISVEIHQEVAHRLGMQLTLLELPWGRCEQYVNTELADGILDNAPLPGCYHSDLATAFYPLAAYVRSDSPLQTFSWEMAKGLKVGMVRGYDYTDRIKHFTGWVPIKAHSDKQLLLMLEKSRVDLIVLDYFSAPILSREQDVKIRALTPFLDSTRSTSASASSRLTCCPPTTRRCNRCWTKGCWIASICAISGRITGH